MRYPLLIAGNSVTIQLTTIHSSLADGSQPGTAEKPTTFLTIPPGAPLPPMSQSNRNVKCERLKLLDKDDMSPI